MKDRRVYVMNNRTGQWENRSLSKVRRGDSFCYSLSDVAKKIGNVFIAATNAFRDNGQWDVDVR